MINNNVLKTTSGMILILVVASCALLSGGCDGSKLQVDINAEINSSPGTSASSPSSDAGTKWTVRAQASKVDLKSVAWSGSLLVAVGDENNNAILTSPDGATWTAGKIAGQYSLSHIIWTGSQFVATGMSPASKGAVSTSPDGMTWTTKELPANDILYSICWSGTRFVAVGAHPDASSNYYGAIYTSSDGSTWNVRTIAPIHSFLYGIVWSGTQFVAVGDYGAIFTSPDGDAWTSRTSGTNAPLSDVVWSGSQFVVVAYTGISLTSPDGISWATHPTPLMQTDIVWSGTQYVAVGGGQGVPVSTNVTGPVYNYGIISSPDGVHWTRRNYLNIRGVVWTGAKFVAVGIAGVIVTSPDGITWTVSSPPADVKLIVWSGTRFVAAGDPGGLLTSPDGITWTVQSADKPLWLEDLIWGGDQFVAVGAYGVQISSDGITWKTGTDTPSANAIVWSGTRYVAMTYNGLPSSPDAVNWPNSATATTDELTGIAWSGSQFTVVGRRCVNWYSPGFDRTGKRQAPASLIIKDGPYPSCMTYADVVITSADGSEWTTHLLESSYLLERITWTGTQFIALDGRTTIFTSPDGIAWTQRYTGPQGKLPLTKVIGNGPQAVAVGLDGIIITSPDGAVWTQQSSGTTANLTGVVWSGTKYVAVGPGVILTSP